MRGPKPGQVFNPTGKGGFQKGQNGFDNGAGKSAGKRIIQALGAAALEKDAERVKQLVEVIWDEAINARQEWAVKLLMTRLCGPDGTLDSLLGENRVISRIEFVVVDPAADAGPDTKEITATYTTQ